ncbi:MAG: hypothetical protein KIT17_00460 [Rubrivivax sp.]|nr:hypothetical protein [Rubrivivax sp.]
MFIAGLPTLSFVSVAGVAVPAAPTGTSDVTLPSGTTNPVTVELQTTGVPPGATVSVTLTPAHGDPVTVTSTPLAGSTTLATAAATVTLPTGASALQATVTFTIVASLGDALSRFAQNERVQQVTVSAAPGGGSRVTLITTSGRRFEAPPEAAHIAAMGS